ncbi:HipA domain-containing protein [Natronosporangium hydrolyticum]|uniref:HipA domain-containing protein n=1 Tax=Natronosporangium hydrolyticum TaxID=2811111 RepID=A0A895YC51_9ACTN|nr:HipA domain-containing protein [Natronosporangium hydrolyticum]QSB15404.1 HipA domain-containing protein [Natronosporangium hydrolyticum]
MSDDVLEVWLGQGHIATLTRTRRRQLQLQYRDEAIATFALDSIVMSVALPVRAGRYRGAAVERWVDSMLPEGETRSTVEQWFGVQRGDSFGLLREIGADCAGAIAFLRPGHHPKLGLAGARLLNDEGLAAAVAALPAHPLGVDQEVRVSLAGLQAKLLLARTSDGRWARPADGAPSTHILKPEPTWAAGLCAAELFTLRLAALSGMPAAEGELIVAGGRKALVLTRFDRQVADGEVSRIHQEDGCAALGIDPTGDYKYQSPHPNSPSLARLAKILRSYGNDVPRELTRLLEAATLRVAVGDTDGHARNYAFLHVGSGVELAPIYDAAPTYRFASSRRVGLWLAGQSMLSSITAQHLFDEFTGWQIPADLARRTTVEVLERLSAAVPRAAAEVPQLPSELATEISERIRRLLDQAAS